MQVRNEALSETARLNNDARRHLGLYGHRCIGGMRMSDLPTYPGALLGFTKHGVPIRLIAGGAPEDDTTDDGDDDDDAQGDGDDDWTPPTREEHERMQSKLSKANREAASRRRLLEEHGIDHRSGKKLDADDDDESDTDDTADAKAKPEKPKRKSKAAEIRAARREEALKKAVVTSTLKSELATAGWNGKGDGRVMRLLDLDEIDVDDEGNVTGLEDQIAELKDEFPEWFKRSRNSGATSGGARQIDGAEKTTKGSKSSKGWLETVNERFESGK